MAELSIYAPSAMKGPTAQSVGGGSTDPAAGNEAKEQRPGAHSHSIGQTVGGGSTDPAARNQKTTRPMEGRAAAEKIQNATRLTRWDMANDRPLLSLEERGRRGRRAARVAIWNFPQLRPLIVRSSRQSNMLPSHRASALIGSTLAPRDLPRRGVFLYPKQ
jgi:hypothetical protein